MTDIKKTIKPTTAPKIMDVINKRTQASATSRPVITGKKPQADPMVVTGAKSTSNLKHKMTYGAPSSTDANTDSQSNDPTLASEPEQTSKAPLSIHHALRLEPVDPHKVGEVFTPSDNSEVSKSTDEATEGTTENVDSPEVSSTTDAAEPAEPEQPELAPENTEVTEPSKLEESDSIGENPLATNPEGETEPEEQEKAAEETLPKKDVSLGDPDDQQNPTAPKDSIDDQSAKDTMEPIDLLRDQVHHDHSSALAILLGLIIIILLAAVAVDLAVDASLISLNVPHTHFFS